MRHAEIVAARMLSSIGCERSSIDSRQQRRARLRGDAMEIVNSQYGPEPRANRRRLSLRFAKQAFQRQYREIVEVVNSTESTKSVAPIVPDVSSDLTSLEPAVELQSSKQ